jgi:hypothetical protein
VGYGAGGEESEVVEAGGEGVDEPLAPPHDQPTLNLIHRGAMFCHEEGDNGRGKRPPARGGRRGSVCDSRFLFAKIGGCRKISCYADP